jgi:2'-5' RNA ligase superfamily
VASCRRCSLSAAALPAGGGSFSDRCRKFRPRGTLEPYFRAGGMLRMSSDGQGRMVGEAGEETGGTAWRQSHCENDERHETPTVPVPPPLYHHWTVCVVPPPSPSTKPVWGAITEARTRLRDPGLFRWPPHVNLLYPFVDCSARSRRSDSAATAKQEEEGDDPALGKTEPSFSSARSIVRQDVLDKLRKACEQIEPFTVELRHLGTFGSAKRGVLWLDPQCRHVDHDNSFATNFEPGMDAIDEAEAAAAAAAEVAMATATPHSDAPVSPLVRLQRLLEDEFPYCTTQRTVGNGSYRPHMTLSHFVDLEAALQARAETNEWWSQLSRFQTGFVVDRVYVLTRKGDDGQFERVAEVRMGRGGTTNDDEAVPALAMIHCFEAGGEGRFPDMPTVEYDWVRDERMALKKRRNKGGGRRRGRRRSNSRSAEQRPPSPFGGDTTTPTSATDAA